MTTWYGWCSKAAAALAAMALVAVGTVVAARFFANRTQAARKLHIAAPCALLKPVTKTARMFEREFQRDVHCSFGMPEKLLHQIERGKTHPDLFLSSGGLEIERLEAKGLIDPKSRTVFGEYEILLIVPKDNPAGVESLDDLTGEGVRGIAVADPEANALGRYAKQSLINLGVWENIEPKVVFPPETIHGITYVMKGKVDASFALNGCPFETAPDQADGSLVSVIEKLPSDSHGRVFCIAARLKASRRQRTAREFIDYLLSPKIQKRLAELGVPNVRSQPDEDGRPRPRGDKGT